MSNKPVAAGKSSFDLIDTEKVFSIISLKPGSSFLDLACGVGKYSIEATKFIGEDGRIYAVDLWPEGINFLKKEAGSLQIKIIETMLTDITNALPLNNVSIDSCLMATILHDLSRGDQQSVIKEAARLLKPNGMLNIIEFKKLEEGPGPNISIRIDEKELDKLITPYGFDKISHNAVGDYNYLTTYKKST